MAATLEAMSTDRVNFLRAMTEGVFASPPSEAMLQWMWQIFMDASPLAAQALADLGPLDQRATLAGLVMPVLSLVGGKDVVVDPAIGRTVGDYHDNTRVVEFADAGHAPFLEDSAAYHAALIEFLNQQT